MDEEFESASEGESPSAPNEPSSSTELAQPSKVVEKSEVESPKQAKPETWSVSGSKPPAVAAPATAPTEEGAGWNAWGSFFKNAVSVVTESLQSDMDGLMTTARDLGEGLKKVTEDGVDRVYDVLDPGHHHSPTAKHGEPSVKVTGTAKDGEQPKDESNVNNDEVQPTSPGKIPVSGIVRSTETVLTAIDKTLDFTSDLLGTAVFTGYKTIEAANIPGRLGEVDAKHVGQTLVSHGLTALEAIGSVIGTQAAHVLAEQRTRSLNNDSAAAPKKKRQPSIADYFEDNCGNAHLQALEMLSTEADIKMAQLREVSEDNGDLKRCLEFIDSELDKSNYSEEVKDLDSSVLCSSEGLASLITILADIKVTNATQIKQLSAHLTEQVEMINDSKSVLSEKLDMNLEECDQMLNSLKNDATVIFADFAEKSCEQFLRIAEIMLMLIAEDRLERQTLLAAEHPYDESAIVERSKKFASALKQLIIALIAEISLLSRNISAIGNDLNEKITKSSDNAEDAENCDKSVKRFHTSISNDLTSATDYINEAVQSTKAILKLMLLSSISQPSA